MIANKKIAFFGTPDFTVSFLEKLAESGAEPSLIITNPDRPKGRGMHLVSPEPKIWGEKRGIRIIQPEKLDEEFFEEINKETWDLFVVVAYGKIIPEKIITLPRFGTINVHYSLLPKYRGATPVESAILNGDTTTGVCIQQMRYLLDSGPIILEKEISIEPNDTTVTLRKRLNDEALILIPEVISLIFTEKTNLKEQDESKATFCKKIKKEDGQISLDDDALLNDRKYRAYAGSPGVFFIAQKNGKDIRVKIKKAHLEDGSFILNEVIPENGKPMSGEEFSRFMKY